MIVNGDHVRPSSSEDSSGEELVRKKPRTEAAIAASTTSDNMTSKDYYFDSYSHFGKYSVCCMTSYMYMYLPTHPIQGLIQRGGTLGFQSGKVCY